MAEEYAAQALVIAVPTGDGALVRELSDLAREVGLELRVVPSVRELLGGDVHVDDLRKPTEADLLGRHKVETDLHAVSEYIKGKRVVVTGAGGSIGSELCRQLSAFEPAALVMVDRDESGLHGVQLSLDGRAMLDSDSLVLLDIRDRARVARLFAEIKPDVVFHAAALKHLPLLQAHPSEALKSNVWGTLAVLDAAAAAGVSHFVNISTDKAANAVNALGYSKRAAEGLTSHFGQQLPGHLPERAVRQRARQPRLGAHVVPGPARGRQPADRHAPRRHPVLHDDRGGRAARDPGRRDRQRRARAGPRHGRPGAHLRRRPPARGEPRRPSCPSSSPGCGRARSCTKTSSATTRPPTQSQHELIRCVDVPPLDPALVRDLDPTCCRDDVLVTLERLARSIDENIEAPVSLDIVMTEVLEDGAGASI